MTKQQTPLQKLDEWVDKVIKNTEGNLPAFIAMKNKIKELLPEEKKFAEDAFKAGDAWGSEMNDFSDGRVKSVSKPDFTDFYKQYTDE